MKLNLTQASIDALQNQTSSTTMQDCLIEIATNLDIDRILQLLNEFLETGRLQEFVGTAASIALIDRSLLPDYVMDKSTFSAALAYIPVEDASVFASYSEYFSYLSQISIIYGNEALQGRFYPGTHGQFLIEYQEAREQFKTGDRTQEDELIATAAALRILFPQQTTVWRLPADMLPVIIRFWPDSIDLWGASYNYIPQVTQIKLLYPSDAVQIAMYQWLKKDPNQLLNLFPTNYDREDLLQLFDTVADLMIICADRIEFEPFNLIFQPLVVQSNIPSVLNVAI